MKIAYIFCPIPHHGRLNGIVSQCLTWADSLRNEGHQVDLITSWETHEWGTYDVIHVFGSTDIWFYGFITGILSYNPKVVWSPICDNIDSPLIQRFKSHVALPQMGLFSLPYIRRKTYLLPIRISVRSQHERNYISQAYGVPMDKFDIVPLGISSDIGCDGSSICAKENFCFHLSTLYQGRKNVIRLVKAARKYGFKLVLAGTTGTEEEFRPISEEIAGSNNIEVLGRISEEKKIELYKRAKVFALPSISEGVGIAALDAAHYGCDIVITNVGGPKEYYADLAWIVDPYDVDAIGNAICSAMVQTHQPNLKTNIDLNYTNKAIVKSLLASYYNL
jgi:glycosyltransferase involved in cell wall biosynthesis